AAMRLARLRDARSGQETAEQAGQRFIAACGLADSADAKQLRQLEAKALANSSPHEPPSGSPLPLKPLALMIGPIVDGHVIPDEPDLLFAAGRQHSVPLIVGNTRDEMSIFLMGTKMPADEAAYIKKLKDDFGDLADSVARAYPGQDAKQIRSAAI